MINRQIKLDETGYESIPERYGRLVSCSLPCPGVSLTAFLRQALGQERFYWESNRDEVALAGVGTALELLAWGADRFNTIQRRAGELFESAVVLDTHQPLAAPRLFGGFAFRDDFVPDVTWSSFSPAHFVLPHYQLVTLRGESWLTINAHIPMDENPDDLLADMRRALRLRIQLLGDADNHSTAGVQQQPAAVNYPMSYDTWTRIITDATERMKRSELNKAVLSRVCEIRFDKRVDVDSALHYLADHYTECYRFLFEPRPHHAFYGATPELLADVSGSTIKTMALAGSIQRGKTPEEDDVYARQLMDDPKERYEHGVVVSALSERLSAMTVELNISDTGVYRLNNIQHLYTAMTGILSGHRGVLPVVAALHPTPALGGSPRHLAMDLIRESEPVPRGWYAAPVGWIDRNLDGQFAVAIRSAVAQDKRVWMYAGAGIVADSIPEKEWRETALKFRPMLDALGILEQVDV